MDKVTRLLHPRDAYEVFQIQLVGGHNRPDVMIWEPEKNGIYTVRSGYRLFVKINRDRQLGEVSYADDQRKMWKKIWKMQIPHKIRVFAWRVCHNGLPTLRNLLARKVIEDAVCKFCNKEEEDINHALLYCSRIEPVLATKLSFLNTTSERRDIAHMVNLVISRNIPGELEELFLCLWGMWYSRNQFIFEQKIFSPQMAIDHALTIAGEYICAHKQRQQGTHRREGWSAPPEGVLKLNVDGALFEDQCRYGIGMVLRDAIGKMIFSASKPERGSMDPMEAELLAMLRDCLGRRLGPKLLGQTDDSGQRMVKDFVKILNRVNSNKVADSLKLPESFSQLISGMKHTSKDFPLILKAMMERSEREIRELKFSELMNKHFAASAVPKGIHFFSLRLTDEYASGAHARKQLPSPELLPSLSDNSYYHFVLSTDNTKIGVIYLKLCLVTSAVQSSLKPEKIVFHVITDKKTYAGMHSWFALNPVSPAIIEVKGVHQFDWLTRENIPVLEAVENHNGIRSYYHGNHVTGANLSDTTTPRKFVSKLQARSPKYISLLNHLHIYLPETSDS
ncbi:unnamed protein product [Fraxinus pennsylvanica]|uniref:Hexosyltransferase n=1 Tax=Fraxinus pennsylvanica TaxID=56036 RepID=A0AAD2DRI2_9LAMI|nr:unnamed protein product [Fraxinus pennsylvanica]